MRYFWMLVLTIGSLFSLHAQDDFNGVASYYADKFVGKSTASGDTYHHHKYTCAHKTLPFGTKLIVTNPANNKSVEVVVNDRGPFVKTRVIDLSKAAAIELGIVQKGLAFVECQIVEEDAEQQAPADFETSQFLEDAEE
jgi:rare lipoprotein A